MNKKNCALKLVDEIILYYDVRSKKHQITTFSVSQFLAFTWSTGKEKSNMCFLVVFDDYESDH